MFHPLFNLDVFFFTFPGLAIVALFWFRKQSSAISINKPGTKVSATYWGSYYINTLNPNKRNPNNTAKSEAQVTLPKITAKEQTVIAGSNKYSKGKPVKTLRS